MIGASLTMVPALWVMSALTVLLFGVAARAALLGWVAVAYVALAGYLADIFGLPAPVRGLSPFEHVPAMPAEDFAVVPVVTLTVVAAVLILVGLAAFERRSVEGG